VTFQPELVFPGSDEADQTDADEVEVTAFAPVVEVVRSAKRRKTVGAQLVGGTLRVTVPSWMPAAEVDRCVAEMTRRFARKHSVNQIDLPRRARQLAAELGLPTPTSIRWAGDLRSRWGSCTPANGTIRLSSRLAGFPAWVLDYVVVHELCHLVEIGHTPAFWALVGRYPKSERARGYLMAKAGTSDDDAA
jgi:predicted metal-dependent hydrolase